MSSSWMPVLHGDDAAEARGAIEEIARALEKHRPARAFEAISLALFWACADEVVGRETASHQFDRNTAAFEALLAQERPRLWFIGGLVGAAWIVQRLDPNPAENGGLVDIVDASVAQQLQAYDREYDLISGLVGYGTYWLDRQGPVASSGLRATLDALGSAASEWEGTLTWKTRPEHLPRHQRELHSDGHFNLGLAHGIPGVIAFLSDVVSRAGDPATDHDVRDWLERSVAFMRRCERPRDLRQRTRFSWAVPTAGDVGDGSRTAWCYGDLGIALALSRAAVALADDALRQFAHSLATSCAQRRPELCGCVDAGLCHGRAGIAHGLNRLWQATGDDGLAEASRLWFRRTLSMRRSEGLAGFPARKGDAWVEDAAILTGAAGVGLALIAATTSRVPQWDRLFLFDIAPGSCAG